MADERIIATTSVNILQTSPSNVQQLSDQSFTQLYESAENGDSNSLSKQIGDSLHLQLTPGKNSLLHILAQFHDSAKCVDVVLTNQSLTNKQSMLTWKNIKGETAMHIAAKNGRFRIVQALLEQAKSFYGEEIESGVGLAKELIREVDQNGDTPLHLAVRNKHVEVVKILVKEEDPDFPHPSNKKEETPLYLAVESINKNMVEPILESCSSLSYKGPGGRTALHASVIRNCLDHTGILLEHVQLQTHSLITKGDEFGWTPLHYAARFNFVSMARKLLKVERSLAYIVAENDENKTALHVAAWHGNVEVMKELLKYCPDCWEMTTSKGQNILHIAVDCKKQQLLNFIISCSWAGNLINEKDADENTPLHVYATSTKLDGRFLVNHVNANQNIFNGENLTPLDMLTNTDSYIFIEGLKKRQLRKMGAVDGYRNIIQRDLHIYRVGKENMSKFKKYLPNDIRKQGESHLIVAALVATVTFAAGFTVPGGYNGNEGPNQGMAILSKRAAFKAFVVSDTIALACSIIAVSLYFASSMHQEYISVVRRRNWASVFIIIATIAMMVAFMTGFYTILGPSKPATIVFLFSSLVIFISFLLYARLIVLVLKRGIYYARKTRQPRRRGQK